ncbi:protein misato homolog 1 [Neocloeon triangulifer]|uniref:protein misato homolog 1 n=1 Tax=Neocloeon triangulifer TaxID=2078957 RepID=UPI00286F9F4F|nr:protein misato homolog 1 [Neocloeon triangulifer]
MAGHREVISLQFGHYSNFIGTHWWNIQELAFDYTATAPSEINHDVLFREGETRQGHVTYTPRLLLVDLKGSLGSMPEHGGLYETSQEEQEPEPIWVNQVEVQRKEKFKNNEFLADLANEEKTGEPVPQTKQYKLDDCVDVWSDFLRTRYHPRSINIVQEYERGSESSKFDAFPQGAALWKTDLFEDTFVDSIRRYAEESDNLQGFQVLVDSVNAFGGLASAATQFLADDYSSKSIFTFPVGHGSYPERLAALETLRTANVALCIQNLALHSTMMVPISTSRGFWQQNAVPRLLPHVNYKPHLPYHTSSLIAATLEGCTLPFRVHNGLGMSDLEHSLVFNGRKAVAASLNFPFPIDDRGYLLNTLEDWEGPLLQGMSACCDMDHDRVWAQSISIRGVPLARLKPPNAPTNNSNPAYTSTKVDEMLLYFLQCTSPETKSHVTSVNLPCSVGAPFPNMFAPSVGQTGFLVPDDQPNTSGVRTVPMLTGLHSSRSVGAMLESLQSQASHSHWRNLPQLAEAGLERDDYSESLEQLLQFAECYNEEFEV